MPIAALVHLAVGLGFALLARERVRADGPFPQPSFQLVLMHAGGVVAPIALYFYAAHPAWSWLYLVDPGHVPGLAILPLMVGHAVIVIGGYYAGALLLRAERRKVLVYGLGGIGVLVLVLTLLARARLGLSTSYAGYKAGHGRAVMEVPLGWAVVIAMLATAGSVVYVAFELSRDARRVRSR